MRWQQQVNNALDRVSGYRLLKSTSLVPQRAPGDAVRGPTDPEKDRLLRTPVFVLSSVRSGSTLLRVMLSSHSQIHAPHETHFRRISVSLGTQPVQQAMESLGITQSDVEHLLWDRLLHRELVRSRKLILVEKTPSNVFGYRRLATCWPEARFIFLLRHPMSIAQSWHEAEPRQRPMHQAISHTYQYMKYLERARHELDGLEVRYEKLTTDPAMETRRICTFLDVGWEPDMLVYGKSHPTAFVKGVGDWRDKIRTGTVQPGRPLPPPDTVPVELQPIARAWGYLS
ncbi:MAG: hypothetical protein AVDCRST_MAG75-130 [uncultured Propionibacteriaceae bacterium]|uniref:Sulfotransferase n=1 Tax=uncultured Propionibacteriaceae bacterium TaxID=257457 RepID=A0A6J4MXQ1_9ACTN|nr:MAG: hypothetical protein AVDCRST_MAG75-130 [uncultured Propionibacteriaceae bacterium]